MNELMKEESRTVVSDDTVLREKKLGINGDAIVVVDDDPNDALLTKRGLTGLGLRNPIRIVLSGRELMSYLEGEGLYRDRLRFPYPTLILLDLHMPEKDGFAVLEWLRDHPVHSGISTVILSGSDELRRVTKAFQLGAKTFFTKPFNPVDLETAARDHGINIKF